MDRSIKRAFWRVVYLLKGERVKELIERRRLLWDQYELQRIKIREELKDFKENRHLLKCPPKAPPPPKLKDPRLKSKRPHHLDRFLNM
jgi:hypothetical protein